MLLEWSRRVEDRRTMLDGHQSQPDVSASRDEVGQSPTAPAWLRRAANMALLNSARVRTGHWLRTLRPCYRRLAALPRQQPLHQRMQHLLVCTYGKEVFFNTL